ncbi:F0F1 ATP synthase subunit delta [Reyranella sp. CPCC 100927]|uniref:F0F1 ATP synthase subunit delta n=1 Tax=Reyranella sp. CPCC 100927 TaxID=2599616 RepID=UPI0011B61615|nr:F0F1 ATP synthase subunit delta [Reyranella sp. CPCC 100927]TWT15795.1 F0F1 ATP synthase subunit delta [Reyranella sp. CPCC 100927]
MSTEASGPASLAGRYASALFELADGQKQLDAVAGDLTTLRRMIDESGDLRRLISSPVIGRDAQGKAMSALLEAVGASSLVRRFVGVACQNGRLRDLPGMITAFLAELARRRGETAADVVSATPLSEAQMQALSETLRRLVGNKVSVNARVDADLLGGLVVKVGSRMFDSSIRTKLQRLQLAMKGVG